MKVAGPRRAYHAAQQMSSSELKQAPVRWTCSSHMLVSAAAQLVRAAMLQDIGQGHLSIEYRRLLMYHAHISCSTTAKESIKDGSTSVRGSFKSSSTAQQTVIPSAVAQLIKLKLRRDHNLQSNSAVAKMAAQSTSSGADRCSPMVRDSLLQTLQPLQPGLHRCWL